MNSHPRTGSSLPAPLGLSVGWLLKGGFMRKVLILVLLAVSGLAYGSCPPDRPYGCVMTLSGKMRCGCGIS
jgi:hypothetical protein